jgi:hypothetical protein
LSLLVGWTEIQRAAHHLATGDPEFDDYGTKKRGKFATVKELMQQFTSLSIKEKHDWYRNLLIAGYLPGQRSAQVSPLELDAEVKESTETDPLEAYMKLLQDTADLQYNQGLKVTPEQVLRSRMAYRLQAIQINNWDGDLHAFDEGFLSYLKDAGLIKDDGSGSTGSGGGESSKPKPYRSTTVTRDVNFMDPADAKALTRGLLQQELGRDPTKAEYEEFLHAINAAERKNPTVTRTTTRYGYDEGGSFGPLGSNSVTHGGITGAGLNELMLDKARSQPDWAEWQAVGTYFPALLAALGPLVPGA